jgi:hypothetical protein
MSEIINLEIKADQSGADEALKQVNKSLKEGTEAAEALSHVLDGDVAGAFKSLGELSTTLGVELGLAFSPAEIIAFAQVVAEVADKLSKLIADTYIYTDAQKAEDKAIKNSNDSLVAALAHVKALGRETQIAAAKTEEAKEKLRLKFELEDLGGNPDALRARLEGVNTQLAQLQQKVDKGPVRSEDNGYDPYSAMGNDGEAEAKIAKDKQAIQSLLAQRTDLVTKIIQGDALIEASNQNLANAREAHATAVTQAEISGTMQRNEAALGLERSKWNAIKALVKTTTDENEAIEIGFENRDYEIKSRALQKELDLAKKDPNHPEQVTALQKQIEALALQHQAALNNIRAQGIAARHKQDEQEKAELAKQAADIVANAKKENDAEIKAFDEKIQAEDEGYKGQIEVAKIASDSKIQLIEQDFERGKINRQQEIALIAQEKERELEIEKLTQQKRWALWAGDVKKQQEIQNQINKLVAQAKNVETKAATAGLKAQEQQYKQVFSQIGNAFKTNVLSMLEGTETITKGFQKMYQSLLSSLADYIAQKAEKKAEEWAIDKLFHTKSVIAETGAATGKAMTASFASVMSALPFPANVAAAPAVAAAAGAQATGFGLAGLAAMFELGGIVPQDGLAYLHKDEKIIPASKSGTGAGLDGIGGITVVVNHSVSAVDAASFQGHIRRHSNMIANEVTRALKRKGAR